MLETNSILLEAINITLVTSGNMSGEVNTMTSNTLPGVLNTMPVATQIPQ